jgi:hypothetical protein
VKRKLIILLAFYHATILDKRCIQLERVSLVTVISFYDGYPSHANKAGFGCWNPWPCAKPHKIRMDHERKLAPTRDLDWD